MWWLKCWLLFYENPCFIRFKLDVIFLSLLRHFSFLHLHRKFFFFFIFLRDTLFNIKFTRKIVLNRDTYLTYLWRQRFHFSSYLYCKTALLSSQILGPVDRLGNLGILSSIICVMQIVKFVYNDSLISHWQEGRQGLSFPENFAIQRGHATCMLGTLQHESGQWDVPSL